MKQAEVRFHASETEKEALMTIYERVKSMGEAGLIRLKLGLKKLESQLRASHKQQISLNEKLHFQANQIFEKDEKLKKYRRIGMKAVKDKDALQKIVDSWFASSKNLWKLIDCGISSTVKIVNDDLVHDQIPIPSVEQVTIATQKTQPQVPKPTQTVDPSCAQHVKPPRQQIKTPVTSSPIPSNNRQNWNQRMQRDLGAGYSFERKPCFVCGSLSHLIKDCDYYEKKMAREAALKSQRVIHTNVRQASPAWTNINRVNKANQFTPRPVNIRPNLSTASNTFKTGRVNVNTGHGHVNSGSVHVNAGTQVKSGASRFNTGKQHERITKKRTKNKAKTTKPDSEWKSCEGTKPNQAKDQKSQSQSQLTNQQSKSEAVIEDTIGCNPSTHLMPWKPNK
ncbi:hypothetical protein Tco_0686949 [Tanacetum coccineum]